MNYADTIIYFFLYVPFTMDLLKQDIKHISHTLNQSDLIIPFLDIATKEFI